MIVPTPGRIVWYRAGADDVPGVFAGEVLAAIVAKVLNDYLVNLAVFGADGSTHPRQCIPLKQFEDDMPEMMPYASWMPWQIAQALSTQGKSIEDAAQKAGHA